MMVRYLIILVLVMSIANLFSVFTPAYAQGGKVQTQNQLNEQNKQATINITNAQKQSNVEKNPTLQKKYYRQALFYYFQDDYANALNLILQSKRKLQRLDDTSRLFAAGLQVNMGLQIQAKETLLAFDKSSKTAVKTNDAQSLLLVALLSLTEQYVEQGDMEQAQQTLAKIDAVPTASYQQYHVLSQLAYWPARPPLVADSSYHSGSKIEPTINVESKTTETVNTTASNHSPYVQLNIALRLIEEQKLSPQPDYQPAIELLKALKSSHWQAPKLSFWQSLFSTEDQSRHSLTSENEEKRQHQAINDYAQLLLAQVYVQEQQFERAFYELKSFPQQSPFTESALFLFAFSAQQIKQYTISLSLLTLLHQQYPYSNLGWQAGTLKAEQLTQQQGLSQGLSQGWDAYQKVEAFFVEKLHSLNSFEQEFLVDTAEVNTESVWLKEALLDDSLSHLYQQLNELQTLNQQLKQLRNKSDWLKQTITLNINRKARLAASKTALNQQAIYEKLTQQRENLAAVLMLASADPQQNGFAFADKTEQVLLDRVNRSKKSLTYLIDSIAENPNKHLINKSTLNDYKSRLARIESVITWQLKKEFSQRAWQHKQQLSELDNQIARVDDMRKRIALLSNKNAQFGEHNVLTHSTAKQQAVDMQLIGMSAKRLALTEKLVAVIETKISKYSAGQRKLLAQHLLNTRREMAGILEKMAIQDKKIEGQLNLEHKRLNKRADNHLIQGQSQNQSQKLAQQNNSMVILSTASNHPLTDFSMKEQIQ